MTTTKVAEIVLLDSANYEKTLRLDNPKDNITLAGVRTAFQSAITEGWLLGRNGDAIISVPRVNIVETTKTSLE